MAVNGGHPEEKQQLIELLAGAETLFSGLELFVEGSEFSKTLQGIIGGLQRSMD